MNLKITDVAPEKEEFIKIEVLNDCNLLGYAVLDATYDDTKETDIHRHFYSFPDMDVTADQTIYLYTSKGEYKFEPQSNSHFLFWGSEANIWNDKKDAAVLISYSIEDYYKYKETQKLKIMRIIDKIIKMRIDQ